MAKSKKTSDAFDMAADIRKEVAAESVADACSTSVPAIYSLAKGDNPRRAKYDKNADVIGYNLRLPANIHRLLKRHCMETNESMNNVVLVALYRDMKNWEDLAPCRIAALFFLSVRSSARIAARRFRSRVGRRCPDDSVEKRGEWMKGAKAKRLQFGTK